MIIGTNVNLGLKKHLQLLDKTVITSVRSDFAIIKKKWKWSETPEKISQSFTLGLQSSTLPLPPQSLFSSVILIVRSSSFI